MEQQNQNPNLSLEAQVLRRQMSAVVRTIELLGGDGVASVDNIVGLLKYAEKASNFNCGFESLHNDAGVKAQIEQELVKQGYVEVKDGKITLTDDGRHLSLTPLPPPIEQAFERPWL